MPPTLNRLLRMVPELVVRTVLIGLTIPFLHVILRELVGLDIPLVAWLVPAAALWLPMTVGLYMRTERSTPGPWHRLSDRQKLRRWAGALWTTPLIMFLPLWLGLFYAPSALIEHWDFFALFFGLPFAAALALYFHAARSRPIRPETGDSL